jgi:hypothetical protein
MDVVYGRYNYRDESSARNESAAYRNLLKVRERVVPARLRQFSNAGTVAVCVFWLAGDVGGTSGAAGPTENVVRESQLLNIG